MATTRRAVRKPGNNITAEPEQHYHRSQPATVQFPILLTRPVLVALLGMYRQSDGHTFAGSSDKIRFEWRGK